MCESHCRSRPSHYSCKTHASATRLLDLAAWARLSDPSVEVYLPDLPVWFCRVFPAPRPPPANLSRAASSSLPLVLSFRPSSLPLP
eukprot:4066780-Pyramimonas_sp.AAC.1